ncbi:Gx transporter family protein, partial [Romboutsia sp. 13368]|uniref:Gx transporter family protein n=1 Tax=Romboutsia sp. 13368 TaxID=2708053 RepID=UPI0025DAAC8F
MSLLVSMALVLSLVERMMPLPFVAPGAKLGLANLVIIIAVYTLGNYRDAFVILILRVILAAMASGNLSSLLYSISGGILSFLATIIVKTLGGKHVSIIGVSASSAVFHNIGQLLTASLILHNFNVFLYLPVLSIVGIITGVFIGLSANYILNHFYKTSYFN